MGAGYGGVSSAINDLPMEEVVYETLMGVFFSVNGRSSWENRATKSIVERAPELERTLSMDKAKAHVRKQPWFKDESPEFQMYWDRYLESIRKERVNLENYMVHHKHLVMNGCKKWKNQMFTMRREMKLLLC